jgi:predicted nucleic acid-binding protein
MTRFVIDASVVVKLFFDEEHSADVERLVADAREMLAPDFLFVEVANVFWKRMRRDKLEAEAVLASIRDALALPITSHNTANLLISAFQIAAETGRTVYDCTYLALAIREKCPLITADERFFNALKGSPFSLHTQFVGELRR